MLSLQTTRSYWMYTCPKLKLCSYWFIKGSLLRNFTKLVQKCNATLHNIHIPSLKSSKYPSSQPGMNWRAVEAGATAADCLCWASASWLSYQLTFPHFQFLINFENRMQNYKRMRVQHFQIKLLTTLKVQQLHKLVILQTGPFSEKVRLAPPPRNNTLLGTEKRNWRLVLRWKLWVLSRDLKILIPLFSKVCAP